MAKLIVSSNERFLSASGNTVLYDFNSNKPTELFDGCDSRFPDSNCEVQVIMNYYLHELRGLSVTVNSHVFSKNKSLN